MHFVGGTILVSWTINTSMVATTELNYITVEEVVRKMVHLMMYNIEIHSQCEYGTACTCTITRVKDLDISITTAGECGD